MQTLMFVALGVILLLLALFFRTGSDVVLTLLGLGITIVGTLGFQGLAGPDGLGWIGLPTSVTTMVPIMLIGLVVDYAIQTVSHYREERADGADVVDAARAGLRHVLLPLGLAAGTTAISFLTNLASPIPANADFGIVAAFGVAFGLVVMLGLLPAVRVLADRRREAAGTLPEPRPIADAIPGAGAVIERLGGVVAARPAWVLSATLVVTVGLGVAAAGISTEFDTDDFLPPDGPTITDGEAIEEAFGGQTETVSILVEADLTDDRVLRNVVAISEAFADDLSRPDGAVGGITASIGVLFTDWTTDDGQGDPNFDPELVTLAEAVFAEPGTDPAQLEAIYDRLAELDPAGFASVVSLDPDGDDDVTTLRFTGLTGDADRTDELIADIEGLWYGDRDDLTVFSGDIIGIEVSTAMTDSQTSSIALTMLAALFVLMVFFGVARFRPMLAVIAVLPILFVLLWVLGTMALLGIPYNVVTALITALSIGIGVDYTIHVIHRFSDALDGGGDVAEAIRTTLTTTGSALVGSALTTALGFGVLVFSPLVPFQQFGIVTAVTILYALLAAILVVPPLLVVWAAYHRWRAAEGGGLDGPSAGGVPVPAAATADGVA